jgi:hypothetical protein
MPTWAAVQDAAHVGSFSCLLLAGSYLVLFVAGVRAAFWGCWKGLA